MNHEPKIDNAPNFVSLRNHFVIAMPGLRDSLFSHSVTYICDHNEDGAMGLIINHPTRIKMQSVFEQLQLTATGKTAQMLVLSGGPVSTQQGLVLHRNQGQWESTLAVTPEICLTASRDIIEAMANDQAPSSAQLALGYAGWGAGQLEQEIAENSWLTTPAISTILFDTPAEERWQEIAKHLGIDLDLIAPSAGHA